MEMFAGVLNEIVRNSSIPAKRRNALAAKGVEGLVAWRSTSRKN